MWRISLKGGSRGTERDMNESFKPKEKMSFEKCRSRAKRKEEREELEETEAGRELNSSIEAGKRRWDVILNSEEKQQKDLWGNSLRAQRPTLVCQTQDQVDLAYSAGSARREAYFDDDATPEWANLFVSAPPSCDDLGGGSEEQSVQ